MTSPTPSAAAPRFAKTKNIAISVLLMVIAGFAPAIVMGALGWKSAVSVAMLAGLAAFMACTMGKGWSSGLILAVPFSVMTTLTAWAAPYAVAAAIVLAVAAFFRGYGAKVGLHNAFLTSVIALGFLVAEPPKFVSSVPSPIIAGLVTLVTVLWVTLVVFVAKRWVHPPKLASLDTTRVLWFSALLALMVGIATWCVVHFELGHGGGWIILTILVVFQPYLQSSFTKAVARVLGTLVGFVIAIVVGAVVANGPLLYLFGTIFLIAAMVFMLDGKPYWLFAAFLTPAIVLYESAGSTVTKVAVERLEATVAGIALALLVVLILYPLARRGQRKSGAAEY
jgi:hypothetical protein